MTCTDDAEALLTEVVETGLLIAAISSAAWRLGVDPAATQSLTTAAMLLYAERTDLLSGGLFPLPSDCEMLVQAADLATVTGEQLHAVHGMSEQVATALDAASNATIAAGERVRAAKDEAAARAARRDLDGALAGLADCEQALELLTGLGNRLKGALDCLLAVPDDLHEAYALPYAHLASGGTLPPGGFLTGVPR